MLRKKNIPGLLLLIDFEKAFDAVSWSFIQFFNFGSNIQRLRFSKTIYQFADDTTMILDCSETSLSKALSKSNTLSKYMYKSCLR